jgi:23S rRNA-/tRNA-specific pseudouridylate synthase
LQFLGTPIVGDRVYGKSADRLYLHAYKLEVTTAPEHRQTFIAPVPDSFADHFPEVYNDVADL